jgi:L-ascorbate metabolism protein UlaG (beta-lactamase superfamily)
MPTLWVGWVIGVGGKRVLFGGDTGLHPEFGSIARRFGPFHAANPADWRI